MNEAKTGIEFELQELNNKKIINNIDNKIIKALEDKIFIQNEMIELLKLQIKNLEK